MLYVVDAGGNAVYKVNPADGTFELVAVIPSMQELMNEPRPEDPMEVRQAVPMQPAFDANGLLHVILLSEEWEAPSIVTIAADGTVGKKGKPGMFMFGLQKGANGFVYVTQGTTDFSGEMPAPGFVARMGNDGSLAIVLDGLFVPHGNYVDSNGDLYVTINSIGMGPGEPSGMLVKCGGVTAGS